MRYNLWVADQNSSRIICYGEQSDLNNLAISALAGLPISVHVLPDGEEPDFTPRKTMNQLFSFESLPTLQEFTSRLQHLQPPFSCDIRQGDVAELIDADTIKDVYDFLVEQYEDCELDCSQPFTIDIEEIRPEPEEIWNTHPALTPEERN